MVQAGAQAIGIDFDGWRNGGGVHAAHEVHVGSPFRSEHFGVDDGSYRESGNLDAVGSNCHDVEVMQIPEARVMPWGTASGSG